MRIRIKLDVRKPLKRKKKITRKNGSEFIVQCKYERLGDFCFRCGMLSHTERFCQRKFDGNAGETEKEWGTWLRAQSRRTAGQEKSKWLRDEADDGWGDRYGKREGKEDFAGGKSQIITRTGNQERKIWDGATDRAKLKGVVIFGNESQDYERENSNMKRTTRPGNEELDGLDLEERKRKRYGPTQVDNMDTEGGDNNSHESTLSKADCVDSNGTI